MYAQLLSEVYQLVATLQLARNCCSFIVIFATLKCERALRLRMRNLVSILDAAVEKTLNAISHLHQLSNLPVVVAQSD